MRFKTIFLGCFFNVLGKIFGMPQNSFVHNNFVQINNVKLSKQIHSSGRYLIEAKMMPESQEPVSSNKINS